MTRASSDQDGPGVAELEAAIASIHQQMDQATTDEQFDRLRPRLENLDYELGLARRRLSRLTEPTDGPNAGDHDA